MASKTGVTTDTFFPYANESVALSVDGLEIENRVDRVSIYGETDITRDQTGLKKALVLKDLLDRIVEALTADVLPENLPESVVGKVKNPFE